MPDPEVSSVARPVRAPSPRHLAFVRGARELLPLAPGIFAWGLVTGVAMVKSGLSVAQAVGMTLTAYAGSAQLAALPLIIGAAPVWIVFATALVVNLRFVIYSLALRPFFAGASVGRRVALGYLTGDLTFVQMTSFMDREPRFQHPLAYLAGSGACNWLAWQSGSLAGLFGARFIPPDSGLDLAGTIALITLVVPLCARLPALAGVVVAALVSVLAHAWPLRLGLLAAVICGMSVAVLLDRRGVHGRGTS
jgi:predicted branched-subunit amino acid permease